MVDSELKPSQRSDIPRHPPSTFQPYSPTWNTAEMPSSASLPASESESSGSGPKPKGTLSKEEWLALKPLIHRLYIEENKTYPQVAASLQASHDFRPTKRQFSRKVEDWGFKKNVKKEERAAILEKLNKGSEKAPVLVGIRNLHPAKIERWKKNERSSGLRLLSENSSTSLRNSSPSANTSSEQLLLEPVVKTEGISRSTSPAVYDSSVAGENEEWRNNLDSMTADLTPAFDWAHVDVPGSPRLTRLLDALKIDSGATSELWWETTQLENGYTDSHNSNTPCGISSNGEPLPSHSPPKQQHLKDCSLSPGNPTPFHSRWTPLNELYGFPAPLEIDNRTISPARIILPYQSWQHWKNETVEMSEKLRQLKQHCDDSHSSIISTMESLANIYFNQSRYSNAEIIYRRLVSARRKSKESTPYLTLSACLEVIVTLANQGRYNQAYELHRGLHSTITQAFRPEHPLSLRDAACFAWTKFKMSGGDEDDEIEIDLRKILQRALNHFGPRHRLTKWIIYLLGTILMDKQQLVESERLLDAVLRMSSEGNSSRNAITYATMRHLALTLNGLERYGESTNLQRSMAERARGSFGEEHPITSMAYAALATTFMTEGKLLESAKFFRASITAQLDVYDKTVADILDSIAGLAKVLFQLGECEEATAWYEKLFAGRREVHGLEYHETTSSCELLGLCYEKQGRWQQAMTLYRGVIKDFNRTESQEPIFLQVLQRRTEHIQEQIRGDQWSND